MISPTDGEVNFHDGFCIRPHMQLKNSSCPVVAVYPSTVEGWDQYILEFQTSDHGCFDVELTADQKSRVQAVLLSHRDNLYHGGRPDPGRHAQHLKIIAADLSGQLEFPWGQIINRYDPRRAREWLIVTYNPFTNIPLQPRAAELSMPEREPVPPSGSNRQ